VTKESCDVLIIGAGVMGLATGIALLERRANLKVVVVDKEAELAKHASGRNSGVLHAGFYYSPDSLKAKFCREGNQAIRLLAKKYKVPVLEIGKVVVARDEEENSRLEILFERGLKNGVELELLNSNRLSDYEPLATSHKRFLWSPSTAISDSKAIVEAMSQEFSRLGGKLRFQKPVVLGQRNNEIFDSSRNFVAQHYVNAAGAQADRLSRSIGIGNDYAMLPFMGIYRATSMTNLPLQRLVYPVPHPINPFLGVHFTLTIDNKVKIGPTAIPIAGREQYSIVEGWSGSDIVQAIKGMSALIRGEAHNFGAILKSELPKFLQSTLIKESAELVPSVLSVSTWQKKPPGIRAQLVHVPTGRLEQDFVVKNYLNSTHILNAVSPGLTSAIPFGKYVAKKVASFL
jgi:L-2-hydroxyglutarate oxidase